MRREQLEHLIRACADLTGLDDIVVVGSQAILGSRPDAPSEMLLSIEADVYPRDDPGLADVIDGSIGEGSLFQATHGYYAHGVGPETAKAPAGWEGRLVKLENANTRGARGWCLEPHDLVLAKLAAGRERDLAFARAAIDAGVVEPATLRERSPALPLDEARLAAVAQMLDGAGA